MPCSGRRYPGLDYFNIEKFIAPIIAIWPLVIWRPQAVVDLKEPGSVCFPA